LIVQEIHVTEQVKEVIKDLMSSMRDGRSAVPVTTEAEFLQSLQKSERILHSSNLEGKLAAITSRFSSCELWIDTGDKKSFFPAKPCGEKDLKSKSGDALELGSQHYFKTINDYLRAPNARLFRLAKNFSKFIKKDSLSLQLTSIPQDKYDSVSYRNRKPDFVAYRVDLSGPYAITLIGDVKPFDGMGRPFSDMQMEHVIDMGWDLMRFVQPWRSTLIVFLTDTRRWQFFELRRMNMELYVDVSGVYEDAAGWNIYLALLCTPLENLGFNSICIDRVRFSDLLGIGKKYVFSGSMVEDILGDKKAAVEAGAEESSNDGMLVFKVFPNSDGGFETELHNLMVLAANSVSASHIPRVIRSDLKTIESDFSVISMSPLGLAVNPCERGQRVYGRHIRQLIDVVEEVHTKAKLAHRDIKPANLFLTMDKELLVLNDWGSAAPIDDRVRRPGGTFGFYDLPTSISSPVTADLIAVVRSSYLMLFNDSAPAIDTDLPTFWAERLSSGLWKAAIASCYKVDYEFLRRELSRIK
jgi:hypothetical protein